MKKVWVVIVDGQVEVFATEEAARAAKEGAEWIAAMSGRYPRVAIVEKEVIQ